MVLRVSKIAHGGPELRRVVEFLNELMDSAEEMNYSVESIDY